MRFQDLEAAEDLLEEAADADSGRLTLARVGKDRRESQVASQPLSSFDEMREWIRDLEPQDAYPIVDRIMAADDAHDPTLASYQDDALPREPA